MLPVAAASVKLAKTVASKVVGRLIGTGAWRSLELARRRARSALTSSGERIVLARSRTPAAAAGGGGTKARGLDEPKDRAGACDLVGADPGGTRSAGRAPSGWPDADFTERATTRLPICARRLSSRRKEGEVSMAVKAFVRDGT